MFFVCVIVLIIQHWWGTFFTMSTTFDTWVQCTANTCSLILNFDSMTFTGVFSPLWSYSLYIRFLHFFHHWQPAEGVVSLSLCMNFWSITVKLQVWMRMREREYEPSYFQSLLELLSHSTCLRGVPFTAGGQVSQLGHELLHLLTLTQHLLPVWAWQSVGQPAALCHQPADSSLA